MQTPIRFIIIDDDSVNNLICRMTFETTFDKTVDLKTFTNPEAGFEYIKSEYSKTDNDAYAVLFLDIHMPVVTGWEFLERFDNLNQRIKDRISIYILSAAIDERDKERPYANKNVSDFLVKPLIHKTIIQLNNKELNARATVKITNQLPFKK